jgi:malonate transporter and related proteins
MAVLGRLSVLLVLLVVGAGLRASGVLDGDRAARLNSLAYYVALPALVFVATYRRSIGSLLSITLLEGLLAVFAITAALAWAVHHRRESAGRRSVAIVQSYHSNLGYLGVPLIAATFGGRVTAIASVILGIVSLLQIPLTIVVLTALNGTETDLTAEFRELLRNPVLLALIAGLAIGEIGVVVPSIVATGLDALGGFALPLALLCVGASLQVDRSTLDIRATGSVVALKIGCMPLVAWLVFSALGVDGATFTAAVVMLAMPTAVSTFVYADELGGDGAFASVNVFVTTLLSVGSLFVLIRLIG